MLRASPNQNLINVQTECNNILKETAQSQPKPESHQFSIPYLAERGGAKRRRARQPGRMLACIGISRKLLRASPSQNLINIELKCNRNFKEITEGQPKPESHQFWIRM